MSTLEEIRATKERNRVDIGSKIRVMTRLPLEIVIIFHSMKIALPTKDSHKKAVKDVSLVKNKKVAPLKHKLGFQIIDLHYTLNKNISLLRKRMFKGTQCKAATKNSATFPGQEEYRLGFPFPCWLTENKYNL